MDPGIHVRYCAEAFGQAFHLFAAHLHLHGRTVGSLLLVAGGAHGDCLQLTVEFQHVRSQFGTADAHATPIEISRAVVVNHHTRVNTGHALNGVLLAFKGTLGTVCSSHTDGKTATNF